MSRYSIIPILPPSEDKKRRYINVKYPPIPRSPSDIYVYVTEGDRYDILAQSYYNDSTLWWVISRANINQIPADTLYPTPGIQIRIPSPNGMNTILSVYETLNYTI